ncbi:hypothetical protein D3C72_1243880 [compost metagenome]
MPFFSVARCRAGNFNCGNSRVCGTPALRSTCSGRVLYLLSTAGTLNGFGACDGSSFSATRSPGSTTKVWLPLSSHCAPRRLRSAAVALSMLASEVRKQPGSPVYTVHSASASALPPKPPMRSMPRMKPAREPVLARASSSAVGPSLSRRSISSSMIFSTLAGSWPCFTVAITMKLEPSCEA